MAAKTVNVYRVEYEKGGNMLTAFIAGFSAEDITAYINGRLGNVRVSSQGMQCRLDAFTPSVSEMVYGNLHKKYGAAVTAELNALKADAEASADAKKELKVNDTGAEVDVPKKEKKITIKK